MKGGSIIGGGGAVVGLGRDDITVNLSQISANTTQVNQTTEIGQTMNSELKFEKSIDIDKHLVPH